jgi:hypothetical protein
MENFGFVLPSREEARTMGLPNAMGNFNELFDTMKEDIKRRHLKKSDVGSALSMSTDEKRISFLNKYFVFKKVRDVNAEQVARILADQNVVPEFQTVKDTLELQKAEAEAESQGETQGETKPEGEAEAEAEAKPKPKPKIRKLKKKMKIKAVSTPQAEAQTGKSVKKKRKLKRRKKITIKEK